MRACNRPRFQEVWKECAKRGIWLTHHDGFQINMLQYNKLFHYKNVGNLALEPERNDVIEMQKLSVYDT